MWSSILRYYVRKNIAYIGANMYPVMLQQRMKCLDR